MTAGLETFAKVRALHDRTDHPGERAAAANRMEALARGLGLTVAEALSKLDAPPPFPMRGAGFADFFDTPYFRDQMAQREQERAVRWREVLDEYGTEEAVFAPSPLERALDEAHARFGPDPGWDAYPLSKVPPEIVSAIEAASPMPATVRESWAEFASWDKLGRDREARGTGYGDHSQPVQVRCRMLEHLLDTMPARTLDDMRARLSWMDWLNNVETAPDPKEERVRLTTLRADIERMAVQFGQAPIQASEGEQGGAEGDTDRHGPLISPDPGRSRSRHGVQTGQRAPTRAGRRTAVLALLEEGLTDREIARRTGVSPTTVGTIRRARAARNLAS